MKAGETLVIMSLLGTLSQAAKLLKVPRIYNAIITSDEMLLPSQAYPALSPIVQSIQYPFPGYVTYQQVIPNQIPMISGFLNNNGKSFTYAMRQELPVPNDGNEKPVLNKANFPDKVVTPPTRGPSLFRPNLSPQEPLKEEMPNFIPNSNFKTNRSGGKPFYPHTDPENGQILDIIDYNNKKVYTASSPVSVNPKVENRSPYDYPPVKTSPSQNTEENAYPSAEAPSELEYPQSENEEKIQPQTDPENRNQYPEENNNYVKNNRPKDQSIADVPPPPLPVGKSDAEPKNPQEYPPAPLGLFF